MKVGLYFGSFNPIHIGHLIIASYIVDNTVLNEVWFIVTPQNPFKPTSNLLSEYDRLYLVKQSVEGDLRLKVSDVEFKLPKPSYTIDTLTYLKEIYPEKEFNIIMGSDSFQNLHKWKNFEQLIKEYCFIIYKRPKFEIKETWNANVEILEAPLLNISASGIRENIFEGKSIRYLVPESVREEIEQNGYYKKKSIKSPPQ